MSGDQLLPPRLGRRAALRLLLSTAGVSVLAACTTVAPSAPAPTQAPPKPAPSQAAVAQQPKRGGTLRVGVAGDVARLDGQLYSSINTTRMSFDRLTAYDANLKPQPMLAESWELSSDAKRLKLNLRKGVQFHTGREFTSEDVKFNVMWVRDPKVAAGALAQQSKWFTDVETPDKYTAVLVAEQPRPAVFDFFEFFNIVDSVTVQGAERDQKLVGTGPFVQTEWVQGDHLTFERFANYWQKYLPYIDGVRVNILKDPQSLVAQLEAGSLDIADQPSLVDFVRLRTDTKYRALTVPSSTNVFGSNATRSRGVVHYADLLGAIAHADHRFGQRHRADPARRLHLQLRLAQLDGHRLSESGDAPHRLPTRRRRRSGQRLRRAARSSRGSGMVAGRQLPAV